MYDLYRCECMYVEDKQNSYLLEVKWSKTWALIYKHLSRSFWDYRQLNIQVYRCCLLSRIHSPELVPSPIHTINAFSFLSVLTELGRKSTITDMYRRFAEFKPLERSPFSRRDPWGSDVGRTGCRSVDPCYGMYYIYLSLSLSIS
jgi:hypothetical protein